METNNLNDLSDVSEENILKTLKERYERHLMYTYSGDTLLSINPYQETGLFTKDVVLAYSSAFKGLESRGTVHPNKNAQFYCRGRYTNNHNLREDKNSYGSFNSADDITEKNNDLYSIPLNDKNDCTDANFRDQIITPRNFYPQDFTHKPDESFFANTNSLNLNTQHATHEKIIEASELNAENDPHTIFTNSLSQEHSFKVETNDMNYEISNLQSSNYSSDQHKGNNTLNFNPKDHEDIFTRSKTSFVDLDPHIYAIAEQALFNLSINDEATIIISGESGSGKTVNHNHLLQYLISRTSTINSSPDLTPKNIYNALKNKKPRRHVELGVSESFSYQKESIFQYEKGKLTRPIDSIFSEIPDTLDPFQLELERVKTVNCDSSGKSGNLASSPYTSDDINRDSSNDVKCHPDLSSSHNLSRKNIYFSDQPVKVYNLNQDKSFNISTCLLSINPIMEAFGNAKTAINENSSRFGKKLDLILKNSKTGYIIDKAHIDTYLLEKGRVTHFNSHEQNFHIFYYFIEYYRLFDIYTDNDYVFDPKCKQDYRKNNNTTAKSKNIEESVKLIDAKIRTQPVFSYHNKYQEVLDCLKSLRIDHLPIENILKGILLLGKLKIAEEDNKGCYFVDRELVQEFSDILSLDPQKFTDYIFKTTITTPVDTFVKNNPLQKCLSTKHSLARHFYSKLFEYLVYIFNQRLSGNTESCEKLVMNHVIDLLKYSNSDKEIIPTSNMLEKGTLRTCNDISSSVEFSDFSHKIDRITLDNGKNSVGKSDFISTNDIHKVIESHNKKSNQSVERSGKPYADAVLEPILSPNSLEYRENKYKTIRLLDIFGFEVFEENSFDQFCINWANEKLQDDYRSQMFNEKIALYNEEGLGNINSHILDEINQNTCLDVIEQKCGIVDLINEESFRNGNSRNLALKISNNFAKNPRISVYRTDFVLKHYADSVRYTIDNFVEKNNDSIVDLQKIFKNDIFPLNMSQNNATITSRSDLHFAKNDLKNKSNIDPYRETSIIDNTILNDTKQTILQSTNYILSLISRTITDKKHPTILKTFQTSLNNLFDLLKRSKVIYVRCIKPNTLKTNCFERSDVCRQLKAAGIMQTIEISRQMYSSCMFYDDFFNKFHAVANFFAESFVDDRLIQALESLAGFTTLKKRIQDLKELGVSRDINVCDFDIKNEEKISISQNTSLFEAFRESMAKKTSALSFESLKFGQTRIFFTNRTLRELEIVKNLIYQHVKSIICLYFQKINKIAKKRDLNKIIVAALIKRQENRGLLKYIAEANELYLQRIRDMNQQQSLIINSAVSVDVNADSKAHLDNLNNCALFTSGKVNSDDSHIQTKDDNTIEFDQVCQTQRHESLNFFKKDKRASKPAKESEKVSFHSQNSQQPLENTITIENNNESDSDDSEDLAFDNKSIEFKSNMTTSFFFKKLLSVPKSENKINAETSWIADKAVSVGNSQPSVEIYSSQHKDQQEHVYSEKSKITLDEQKNGLVYINDDALHNVLNRKEDLNYIEGAVNKVNLSTQSAYLSNTVLQQDIEANSQDFSCDYNDYNDAAPFESLKVCSQSSSCVTSQNLDADSDHECQNSKCHQCVALKQKYIFQLEEMRRLKQKETEFQLLSSELKKTKEQLFELSPKLNPLNKTNSEMNEGLIYQDNKNKDSLCSASKRTEPEIANRSKYLVEKEADGRMDAEICGVSNTDQYTDEETSRFGIGKSIVKIVKSSKGRLIGNIYSLCDLLNKRECTKLSKDPDEFIKSLKSTRGMFDGLVFSSQTTQKIEHDRQKSDLASRFLKIDQAPLSSTSKSCNKSPDNIQAQNNQNHVFDSNSCFTNVKVESEKNALIPSHSEISEQNSSWIDPFKHLKITFASPYDVFGYLFELFLDFSPTKKYPRYECLALAHQMFFIATKLAGNFFRNVNVGLQQIIERLELFERCELKISYIMSNVCELKALINWYYINCVKQTLQNHQNTLDCQIQDKTIDRITNKSQNASSLPHFEDDVAGNDSGRNLDLLRESINCDQVYSSLESSEKLKVADNEWRRTTYFYLEVLSEIDALIRALYCHLLTIFIKRIENFIPSSIIEYQGIKEFCCAEKGIRKLFARPRSVYELSDELQAIYYKIDMFYMPLEYQDGIICHLLHVINVRSFNALFVKNDFLCFNRGVQINNNINILEKFLRDKFLLDTEDGITYDMTLDLSGKYDCSDLFCDCGEIILENVQKIRNMTDIENYEVFEDFVQNYMSKKCNGNSSTKNLQCYGKNEINSKNAVRSFQDSSIGQHTHNNNACRKKQTENLSNISEDSVNNDNTCSDRKKPQAIFTSGLDSLKHLRALIKLTNLLKSGNEFEFIISEITELNRTQIVELISRYKSHERSQIVTKSVEIVCGQKFLEERTVDCQHHLYCRKFVFLAPRYIPSTYLKTLLDIL